MFLHLLDFTFNDYLCRVAVSIISPCRNHGSPNQDTISNTLIGRGGSRTRVQNAFTLKELQQYCNYTAFLFSTATILVRKN